MVRKLFFLALICVSGTSASLTIEDPWKILTEAHQASKMLNYQGTFHLKNSKVIQSMEITHAIHGEDEYTRMTLMDGDPGEMLSHGKNIFVYDSKENNVVIQKRE
ncbi:MAG: hypothetical protein HOH72_05800, partial [Nitrosomonadales bacterium]|nr:hypothetical protein [Nitrosomonadales bacterium]